MKENRYPQWPRGLRRTLAAEYIGVSLPLFDTMVRDGRMPKPKRVDNRTIWDKVAVDRAFDLLDGGSPLDGAGEEVWEVSNEPLIQPHTLPRPSNAKEEYIPQFQIRQQKWERDVPRYQFSTKEKIALRSLIELGGEADISQMRKGAGGVALQMLALRKYALLGVGETS
jgi:predicted DNA-binding transcriptional regulator AlpA